MENSDNTAYGESDAATCSPSSLTRETDQLEECDQYKVDEDYAEYNAYCRMVEHARTLERERDEWRKKAVDLHKANAAMECNGIALKSMCAAAAAEIEDQWSAHCDGDGYGPANLMYRLKGQSPPDLYSVHATHEERSKWMKWRCAEILPENAGSDARRAGLPDQQGG
jgi:hypothetical protein